MLNQDRSISTEVLCVDDGSPNDPFARLPNPMPDHVHLLRKANAGVSAARRHAYQRAKGRYIATPSYSQVVQPLYRSSIGRWENHADYMAPFLARLRPQARVVALVDDKPEADEKIIADRFADRGKDFEPEPAPVLQTATVPVAAMIGGR